MRNRARALALLSVSCFLGGRGHAQRCPDGTDYVGRELRGDEMIIHCRKSKGVEAAMDALKESELGRRILDFLEANKVPIRVDDRRLWAPDSGAAFNFVQRAVLLPPNASGRPAASLAMSIAHEGYHAMQFLDSGMVPCIEAEQDAFFAQNVAYVEMVRNGGQRLAPGDPLLGDFIVFKGAVGAGDLNRLDAAVRDAYGRLRQGMLRWGGAMPSSVLLLVVARLWDFAFDFTENFETLHQRTRHPAYWWDKRPVKRTAEAHEREKEWRLRWVQEHRHELPRDF